MTVKELAENYGTLNLLTAYIMRTVNVSEEVAAEMVYEVDMDFERLLEELTYNNNEEEE